MQFCAYGLVEVTPPTSFAPFSGQQLLEVYRPQNNFHKSRPGPPDLRVVIATPTDPFPPPTLVNYLSAIHPNAPLKYCIVDGSSTSYYSIQAAAVARIENTELQLK